MLFRLLCVESNEPPGVEPPADHGESGRAAVQVEHGSAAAAAGWWNRGVEQRLVLQLGQRGLQPGLRARHLPRPRAVLPRLPAGGVERGEETSLPPPRLHHLLLPRLRSAHRELERRVPATGSHALRAVWSRPLQLPGLQLEASMNNSHC